LATSKGYTGARRRVLIVDDVAENRALLRDLLGPLGMLLGEATNGREALAILKTEPFDLVLTDIVMPFMDGREFAQQAKRHPGTASIPIVAITASVIRDSAQPNPLDSHFVKFIKKPIDADEVLSTVGTLLGIEWREDDLPDPALAGGGDNAAQQSSAAATGGALPAAQQPEAELSHEGLQALYDVARTGDVDALRDKLVVYRAGAAQLIEPLLDLLEQYAMNAICKRLENLLGKRGVM
jgi:CheY-like chemotaxis protein